MGAFVALLIVLAVLAVQCTEDQERERDRAFAAEPGSHPVTLSGDLILNGRWEVGEGAIVETDARWKVTQLKVFITKLDNAVANSTVVRVNVGPMECVTHRRFAVYNTQSGGVRLFAGEVGYQELRCTPFLSSSELDGLVSGEVVTD